MLLHGLRMVSLVIDSKVGDRKFSIKTIIIIVKKLYSNKYVQERLCLAQISNTLLKEGLVAAVKR